MPRLRIPALPRPILTALASLPAVLTLLAAVSGCGDARSPGMIITGDGRMLDNTAENNRDEAARAIVTQLQPHLGEHWRIGATIAELPVWTPERRGEGGDWMWTHATVAVELTGDGEAPLPVPAGDFRAAVTGFLSPRVVGGAEHVAVSVTDRVDAARFQVLGMPSPTSSPAYAAAAAPVVAHRASGARSYDVQAGDTLSDIAMVFYGDSRHWKDIVKANPEVDFNALRTGTTLVIPALPAAGAPTP